MLKKILLLALLSFTTSQTIIAMQAPSASLLRRYSNPAASTICAPCQTVLAEYKATRSSKIRFDLKNLHTQCVILLFTTREWHDLSVALHNHNAACLLHEREPIEAIHWASAYGHAQVVEHLLKTGISINKRDCLKRTALHWATERNELDVVKFLALQKAELEPMDELGKTPMAIARENSQWECVALLTMFLPKVPETPAAAESEEAAAFFKGCGMQ